MSEEKDSATTKYKNATNDLITASGHGKSKLNNHLILIYTHIHSYITTYALFQITKEEHFIDTVNVL